MNFLIKQSKLKECPSSPSPQMPPPALGRTLWHCWSRQRIEILEGILDLLRAPDAQNNVPANPQLVNFQSRKVWECVPQYTVQFLFTEKTKLDKKNHLFPRWLWLKSETVKMTQVQRLKKIHFFPELQETADIKNKTRLSTETHWNVTL